jgi:hypothetical protein
MVTGSQSPPVIPSKPSVSGPAYSYPDSRFRLKSRAIRPGKPASAPSLRSYPRAKCIGDHGYGLLSFTLRRGRSPIPATVRRSRTVSPHPYRSRSGPP